MQIVETTVGEGVFNGAIGEVPQLHHFALQRQQSRVKGTGEQERAVFGVAVLVQAQDDLDASALSVDVHVHLLLLSIGAFDCYRTRWTPQRPRQK